MSVSGTTSFNQTFYQIIYDALRKLNVYGLGRTVSADDMTTASNQLNRMIKFWGTKGLHLWCKEEGVLYFTQYQSKYGFGNSSSIGVTPAFASLASGAHSSQTSASAALGATTLNILNSANMNIGDYIGVVQSDMSLFWTTVATIPNSTSVTLTLGTTQTINQAANVYSFTTKLNKPYRIISARLRNGFDYGSYSTENDLIMNPMSHAEYYDLPIKSINGSTPNQFYYDPQLDYGILNLWTRPMDCSYRVHFTYERVMDDMTNPGDTFDLPQEWLDPIVWNLAVLLAPDFAKEKKLQAIAPMAEAMLKELLDFDAEQTGVSFQPDRDGGGVY